MTTTDVLLAGARAALAGAGVPSPDADAVELLSHVLGLDHGEVRMRGILRTAVVERDAARFEDLVQERAARVPLQHLTGRAHFRHLTLAVGPGVFVPRPETELTAGHAVEAARVAGSAPVVVDLCTGSGAIALAVADEVPGARVHAVELSPEAHGWARRNTDRLGLPVDLRLGDATTAFDDLEGTVDVVVSNPPYIPDGAVPVDPEVRDHDPALALYGRSADGLAVPLAVAARAAVLLHAGGVLVMEHADEQGESLPAALRATGEWRDVVDHRDLAGRPRTTVAVRDGRG
ncbi:peptide chain release factor N(5)-glutamine methyltransferase [Phycicoccus jejuensis]|uniref:peptide chain release factor N(5)-glutamine methyltransferase n=1 Tax=Phycicoccus jejuensis TaxID=367299 RepID=UPI00384C586E